MKHKHVIRQKRDRNRERAYLWGSAARLNDTPLTACPNLIPIFGEEYATELMDVWKRGWNDRDQEQRMQSRHAMKGAD